MAELFNFEKNSDFEIQYGGRVRYFHQFFSTSRCRIQLSFVQKTYFVISTSGLAQGAPPHVTSRKFFRIFGNSPKIHFQGQDLRILIEGRGPRAVSSEIFLPFQEVISRRKYFFEIFWSTFNFSKFCNLILLNFELKVSKITFQRSAKFEGPRCPMSRDI